MNEQSRQQLVEQRNDAYELLTELVTPNGIYASANIGWEGPYHAWFGRDLAYTARFLFAALEHGGDRELATVALDALISFIKWRGRRNDPATGEEFGGAAHEIRVELGDVHAVQHAARTNKLPWYIDPTDGILKNWDTADATPLIVRETLRGHQLLARQMEPETEKGIREMLGWIVARTEKYDGMVGFLSAKLQPERTHSGLVNQGWKDTEDIYQAPDGENAPHPIKDVLVNAQAWAALRDGAEYFSRQDSAFSEQLRAVADMLQVKFNDSETGFVLPSREGLAQAIDGNGNRLEQRAVDQGAVLEARTMSGEVIVNSEVAAGIIDEMMSADMFNPDAGLRNYALGTEFSHGTKYHGSSHTYWPLMSGVVALGLEQVGEDVKAEKIMRGMLNAVRILGTNIEMFVQNEQDDFEPWSHPDPDIGQMSSREQAWTAGAVYYATSYILSTEEQGTGGTQ